MDCVQNWVKADVFTEVAAFRMPPRVANDNHGTRLTGHQTNERTNNEKTTSAQVPGRFRVAGSWQEGDSVTWEEGSAVSAPCGARTLGRRTRLPAQTHTSCSGAWPRTTRGCFFPFVLDSVALGQCEIFNFICRRKKEFDFFFFFLTFLFLCCTYYLYVWWCYKARSVNTLFQ